MLMWVGIEQLRLSKVLGWQRVSVVSPALVELIQEFGPLVPICVRPAGHRRYEIVTNEETWLAAQKAGHHQVPITVHPDLSDDDVLRIRAHDRKEDPISEATRFQTLVGLAGGSRQHGAIVALATRENRSASYVAHALRLLQLPGVIQEALRIGALRAGHGKVLLRVTPDEEQLRLATRIITQRWSVRKTEAFVRDRLKSPAPIDVERLERRLSALIGSPSAIDLDAGELRIRYGGSLDVLDGLLRRLGYVDHDD